MVDQDEPAPAAAHPAASGSRVGQVLDGKYRLVRELGKGGMGAVYEAVHEFLGRKFAIKFLLADLVQHDAALARFRLEAKTAGSLQCENVVAVTDFGLAPDGAPYFVMEHLVGQDLRGVMAAQGVLPLPRAADLLIQACRGLSEAHAAQVIHRDLKPENLFVCKRGDGSDLLKVLDFGIAKLKSDTLSGVRTEEGAVVGTLLYMPPEQVRGDTEIDGRADVYALGAILYELLSGQAAHVGDAAHVLIHNILNRRPTPLSVLRPDLPAAVGEVAHRAMAFERRDRFASVNELSAALRPFASRQVIPLESPAAVRQATPVATEPVPTVGAAQDEAVDATSLQIPGVRRGRLALLLVAMVAVLAAAALGLWEDDSSVGALPPIEARTPAQRSAHPPPSPSPRSAPAGEPGLALPTAPRVPAVAAPRGASPEPAAEQALDAIDPPAPKRSAAENTPAPAAQAPTRSSSAPAPEFLPPPPQKPSRKGTRSGAQASPSKRRTKKSPAARAVIQRVDGRKMTFDPTNPFTE